MASRKITVRVVPLGSPEAGDSHLGSTASERLGMLAELSRLAWAASGRPFPQYQRETMPIRRSTLRAQGGPDDR
ncbi:MAG TPA: hypothetical protein VFK36_05310 [Gemmatimonadales bacterium]|nr:hypothetical protein [Gemmatimonadales bacterium]